jgi:peptide/nickel transport system permease protein
LAKALTINKEGSVSSKLLRKPAVVVSLCIILLTGLVAVFAYLLAPDPTPYANRMIVELGARSPGFSKDLLFLPKSIKQEEVSGLTATFSGKPSNYNALPVNAISFMGDSIIVRHYIDEGIEDTLRFPLALWQEKESAGLSLAQKAAYIREHHLEHRTFYLGTDRYGRDILSRLLIGSRVSIAVGIVAVLLSLSIGIVLGSIAGYFGGVVDNVVMWFINILWAIPTLLLVFAITLTIGKWFWEIFVAIGLTMWVSAARLIRGQVLVLREMEYITAARALGLNDTRIIFRHILPNIAGPLMVIAASNFATAILLEAGLSFLGIGVQPPMPSWGLMIKEHFNFLLTNRPLLALVPGIAIMLLVYAFNVLGNGLRDVLDVRE